MPAARSWPLGPPTSRSTMHHRDTMRNRGSTRRGSERLDILRHGVEKGARRAAPTHRRPRCPPPERSPRPSAPTTCSPGSTCPDPRCTAGARTERSRSRSSSASTPSAGAGPTSTRGSLTAPPNPFAAGEVERYHDAIQRRAETLRAELAPLDDAQLCDVIANGDSDRGLQARPVLAARSEQAEQAARLALRDARDVEIIAAVLSGESHKAVAARRLDSIAGARPQSPRASSGRRR